MAFLLAKKPLNSVPVWVHTYILSIRFHPVISIPSILLIIHTKNIITNIGIKHEVTIITANASIKLFNTFCILAVVSDTPSFTLEINPLTPLLFSSSLLSLISSVVCFAESIVCSIDVCYVVSIISDTFTLTGTIR